jgi:serine/threonine protein kinase
MSLFAINNFKLLQKTAERFCYFQYRAIDLESGNPVDIKLLKPSVAENHVAAASFIHNAHLLKNLKHPVFQKVLAGGCVDGHYFIAVEPIAEASLDALILDTFSLQKEELIRIFSTIGDALRFAHLRGLMHGLLNPRCIYIDEECNIQIADLGFNWSSRLVFSENSDEAKYLARYVPPESYQARNGIEQCDIYSLGVILYEMVNGSPPYDGSTLQEIRVKHESASPRPLQLNNTGLPEELTHFIHRALQIDDCTPFQNIAAFVDNLVKIGDKDTIVELFEINETVIEQLAQNPKTPHLRLEKLKPFFDSNRRTVFSGAAALVMIVLLSVFIFSRSNSDNSGVSNTQELNSSAAAPVKTGDNLASKEPLFPDPGSLNGESSGNGSQQTSRSNNSANNRKTSDVTVDRIYKTITLRVIAESQPQIADIFIDNHYIGSTGQDGFIEIPNLQTDKTYSLHLKKDSLQDKAVLLHVKTESDSLVVEMKAQKEPGGRTVRTVHPGTNL